MLRALLERVVAVGRLTVTIGEEPAFSVGAVPIDMPRLDIAVRLTDRRTADLLALDPEYQVGECYMDGRLTIERGSLGNLMEVIGHNLARRPVMGALARVRERLARLLARSNTLRQSRRNVERHYDLSEAFYRLFLDADLQYSCAYFADPGMTLEEAQAAKKAHIAAKLDLRPGARVLDIGCGWGGMALTLAQMADVDVTGITLSAEQLRVARERAAAAGLADRVRFELIDYRQVEGRFDRIVSVGMFEHVGREHFGDYFAAIDRLLDTNGVALVHSIGRKDRGPGFDRWMREHIFPGGYIPAASEAVAALEATGLWLADMEVLRLHYAATLRHWRLRAVAQRAAIEAIYDARFYRMWEFYLASCEMGFRFNGLMVFQLLIAREVAGVPITRAYIAQAEARLFADWEPGTCGKPGMAGTEAAE